MLTWSSSCVSVGTPRVHRVVRYCCPSPLLSVLVILLLHSVISVFSDPFVAGLLAQQLLKALCSSRRQSSSLSGERTVSHRSWPNRVLMSAELRVLPSTSLPSLIFQTPTIWALSNTALIHALLWPYPGFQQACNNQPRVYAPCSMSTSLTVCFYHKKGRAKVFGRGKQQSCCDKSWDKNIKHSTTTNVFLHLSRPSDTANLILCIFQRLQEKRTKRCWLHYWMSTLANMQTS